MAWYKWYQKPQKGQKNGPWIRFLAEQETEIIRDVAPSFITILSANASFEDESKMEKKDFAEVRYLGDLYVDIDAEDIEEGIRDFKRLLGKLEDDMQFDPEQASLFATGSKGFHCIIPRTCFMSKSDASRGVLNLPEIYKEVVKAFSVDSLDERVYTGRRGRMFRVPNIERPDREGVYKVAISVAEAMSMTPEKYKALCSNPRPLILPKPVTFCQPLGLEFADARERVNKRVKENLKRVKETGELKKRFPNELPPTLVQAMNGLNLGPDRGFNDISMQLAIAAHEMKMTRDAFLAACENLCQNHSGTKYNTYSKRVDRLIEAFDHTDRNICYSFSIGGLKSILAPGLATPDLEVTHGLAADEEDVAEDAISDEVEYSLTMGMKVTKNGIFRKTEAGAYMIVSSLGMAAPKQLIDTATGDTLGYEVDAYVSGTPKGKKLLALDLFLSRNKFSAFTLNAGGSALNASDIQTGALAEILRARVSKSNSQVYTTTREGIDVIRLPDGDYDIIWADKDEVTSNREGMNYRFIGGLSKESEYNANLRAAPELKATEESEKFFQHLFKINTPIALGKMMGWYFAAFFTQPLRYLFKQFPSLQVYGAAGSGKTKTNELLIHLHYFNADPKLQSASSLTPWAFDKLLSTSGSIPLILDEYKPRAMRKDRLDKLRMVLNENYTGLATARGNLSSSSGVSKVQTLSSPNTAPLVVIGEAQESTTSIVERGVIVPLDKSGKRGHSPDFLYCQSAADNLSRLGKYCMTEVMKMDLDSIRDTLVKNMAVLTENLGERAEDSDRSVFNIAVVLFGISFGKKCLHDVYGEMFDDEFNKLTSAILADNDRLIPRVMSEASKVLDVMAHLSYADPDANRDSLTYGIDYLIEVPDLNDPEVIKRGDRGFVEIHLRNAFTKYVKFKRTLGEEALYDNFEAFVSGMNNYGGMRDKNCVDSKLKTSATMQVYAFDIDYITREGVGLFQPGVKKK